MQSIKLIIGLGNPGAEYEKTRHNAGVWFIDSLLAQHPTPLHFEKKISGKVGKATLFDHECLLLIPSTFMNLSGQATQAVTNFYKIMPEEILVAHDEIDLPVGTARLKQDGGHGGHNGLKDIIERLGSKKFYRLRIGVGHPGSSHLVHDYVLHRPTRSEHTQIMESIDKALDVLPLLLDGHLQKAMHKLHSEG